MFANAFQTGFLSIFYSVGSSPLSIWDKQVKNGHIRRIVDDEVKSLVLELSGTNVATTYITTPIKPRASLGIRLPFLVLIVKNMKKYFTFEIQILDDKDMHRRFRVSNFQSTTKVRPFCTTMPIGLSTGWNQIQFNLADFTRRAYGTVYIETMRVQIHANARIRRIYFSDRLYSDEEMPNEYKLFMPTKGSEKRASKDGTAVGKKASDMTTSKISAPITMEPIGDTAIPATIDETSAVIATGVEDVEPIQVPEQLEEDVELQGAPPTPAESELPSPEAAEGEGGEESPREELVSPTGEGEDEGGDIVEKTTSVDEAKEATEEGAAGEVDVQKTEDAPHDMDVSGVGDEEIKDVQVETEENLRGYEEAPAEPAETTETTE